MSARQKPVRYAADFGLEILESDDDLFRWFLLCFLFGKPIRSSTAQETWQLLIKNKIDTPWAIVNSSNRQLVRVLHNGGLYALSTCDRSRLACMHEAID